VTVIFGVGMVAVAMLAKSKLTARPPALDAVSTDPEVTLSCVALRHDDDVTRNADAALAAVDRTVICVATRLTEALCEKEQLSMSNPYVAIAVAMGPIVVAVSVSADVSTNCDPEMAMPRRSVQNTKVIPLPPEKSVFAILNAELPLPSTVVRTKEICVTVTCTVDMDSTRPVYVKVLS